MVWLILISAIVVAALERNRRRQPHPRPRTSGSSDVQDRDTERVIAELQATAGREL
ncbi:hypothetical protein EV138_2811 [Kribbella voronezhensis]|uniref:Uncharacterized protein n=1 Tax=Kribbella voronezhensis TaxID=2512212 RepID=A0A4R7TC31_9ACTN|nr:hypothetical protein [Kribbella voronezhensis]TDU89249.1 hypothetical protein EV138_2811 [Kribbella voronezhensis]